MCDQRWWERRGNRNHILVNAYVWRSISPVRKHGDGVAECVEDIGPPRGGRAKGAHWGPVQRTGLGRDLQLTWREHHWTPTCDMVSRPRMDMWGNHAEVDVMSVGHMLCKIGIHRWVHCRNPDGGGVYLQCQRCGREKDAVTITSLGGM